MRTFRLSRALYEPPDDEWEPSPWPEQDLRAWAADPFLRHDLYAAWGTELGPRPSWLGDEAALQVILAAIQSGRLRLHRHRPVSAPVVSAPVAKEPAPPEVPWDYEPAADEPAREETDELDWIEIEVLLEDGTPVRSETVTITLSDGATRTTTTDENGVARLVQIVSGECELSFSRDRRELRAS